MVDQIKPIRVWGRDGPGSFKIILILEGLGVLYTIEEVRGADLKKPEYLAINPKGRVPSIHDPNTDITLWDSGAIIEYLIERYDDTHRLSFPPGSTEAYHAKQWHFFQATGQGPLYCQYAFFRLSAPEEIPLAIGRYAEKINRITTVLEEHLSKQKEGEEWLVGGKCSYADIVFFAWQITIVHKANPEDYRMDHYPHVKAWIARVQERESTIKGYQKIKGLDEDVVTVQNNAEQDGT